MVSHFQWNKKQIGYPNSFADDWELLSDPVPPTQSIPPSPPGCLDRLFICPAWARKGYCDSKRNLMKKHCPSSCDFCYGKTQRCKSSSNPGATEKKQFKKNGAAQGVVVNRLPMEQREPTGPAMQGCDRASDLKVGYFLLEEFVVRAILASPREAMWVLARQSKASTCGCWLFRHQALITHQQSWKPWGPGADVS